ncbi:Ribosomal RNA small subunit methyltransferase E [Anaerobiospirillum thomasii]|uniref:Ribosomal RNA small subunit methyltransferase E n=1 Tax=Anaerobiospirillum thomasii TaxID=179995 RepID=A0A2X0VAD4_9GAMM|nr:16S rRNA (uracil(1498)-N(3))-methyltransferase [Anaerobiospirillum thomasii]SPT69880.1 Ribosomal RNA small subunit methyltransferase E [Anaerobiospirillum thomasii]SPT71454.1 Ribosomal RNA small subunit methyltransferase E [Anaerobiospirillum thomasii]
MRIPRIYESKAALEPGVDFTLNEDGSGHLCRVLRMGENDRFYVFDGCGHEYEAIIKEPGKRALCQVLSALERNSESPLKVELLQVISRGDKMDFTLQKAVELGVHAITPLSSSRCGVKLDAKRLEKKLVSWQKIVDSACEQCFRAYVPRVNASCDLADYLKNADFSNTLCLTLDPKAKCKIQDLELKGTDVKLLIGPEGGLSDDEIELARLHGFVGVTLGPRILRTETAALVALSVLGSHFGDL